MNNNFGRINQRAIRYYNKIVSSFENTDILPILWYLNHHNGNIGNFLSTRPEHIRIQYRKLVNLSIRILNNFQMINYLFTHRNEFHNAYNNYLHFNGNFIYLLFRAFL